VSRGTATRKKEDSSQTVPRRFGTKEKSQRNFKIRIGANVKIVGGKGKNKRRAERKKLNRPRRGKKDNSENPEIPGLQNR